MAQDGGTVAFHLESKFAVFAKSSAVCTWSTIGHYVGSHTPSLVPRSSGNVASNVEYLVGTMASLVPRPSGNVANNVEYLVRGGPGAALPATQP